MKMRYYMMVALLAATSIAQAQDTYLTDRLTATDDIDGTARFVGMGGALGALGADISAISSNPAAIGLYRKSDIAMTFGAYIPQKTNGWSSSHDRANFEKLARASFDQMGFVWSMKVNDESLNYLNIAFNYQKKANYNMGFYADNLNLNGLSQMDLLSELATEGYDTDYNLTGMAIDNEFLSKDDKGYYNPYRGQEAYYTRHQRGAMQAYDLNFSFNIRNRVYVGATLGMENGNYYSWSSYSELSQDANGQLGDYTLYNDRDNQIGDTLLKHGCDPDVRMAFGLTWREMKDAQEASKNILFPTSDIFVNGVPAKVAIPGYGKDCPKLDSVKVVLHDGIAMEWKWTGTGDRYFRDVTGVTEGGGFKLELNRTKRYSDSFGRAYAVFRKGPDGLYRFTGMQDA